MSDVAKAFTLVNKNIAALIKKIGASDGSLTEEEISGMFDMLVSNVNASRSAAVHANQIAKLENGVVSLTEIATQNSKSKMTYRQNYKPLPPSVTPSTEPEIEEEDKIVLPHMRASNVKPQRDYARIAGQGKPANAVVNDDVDFIDE
ncbi:MAG: hypothetical protein JJ979_03570 [Roseibium sp.]|nr:hypothetical protein [Roseibium sp.]